MAGAGCSLRGPRLHTDTASHRPAGWHSSFKGPQFGWPDTDVSSQDKLGGCGHSVPSLVGAQPGTLEDSRWSEERGVASTSGCSLGDPPAELGPWRSLNSGRPVPVSCLLGKFGL